MSGFSAGWLALREPADHRARDRALLAALGALSSPAATASPIVDLGCGTGSNLRALAPHLPRAPGLAPRRPRSGPACGARERLAAWADRARADGRADLRLAKDGREHRGLASVEADLARDPGAALDDRADLVTAAALFDLVSARGSSASPTRVAADGRVFYTALTYDGEEAWRRRTPPTRRCSPPSTRHQRSDKGFGPAAGPAATDRLSQGIRRRRATA